MAKTSIHIVPCKVESSERHNRREKELDYVLNAFTHRNEHWSCQDNLPQYLVALKEEVKTKTGRSMQQKAEPIREGVVVINPSTTMAELQELGSKMESKFGIKTLQIHIHRDEGHFTDEEFICNNHAHMVFDWINHTTGKSVKLGKQEMIEMQTMVADVLQMERGKSSDIKHLSAQQFKVQEQEREMGIRTTMAVEKAHAAEQELAAITAPLDEIKEQTQKNILQPMELGRWDAIKLLLSKKRFNERIAHRTSKVVSEYQKEIKARQEAQKEVRKGKIEKWLKKEGIELSPEKVESLASKQDVPYVHTNEQGERKGIKLAWDEKNIVQQKRDSTWELNEEARKRAQKLRESMTQQKPHKRSDMRL